MNILALGAHPDDVEFLCAGTLLKYHSQGHKIFIALTTSGNQGSNEYDNRDQIAAIREVEQLEAAKYQDRPRNSILDGESSRRLEGREPLC